MYLRFRPVALVILWLLTGYACVLPVQGQAPSAPIFTIKRGINISHWLSQVGRSGVSRSEFFTEKDVAFLASSGFDHIRIPIDEDEMWNDNDEKNKEAFKLLHQALGWCKQYQLKAIVDLHTLRSHYYNNKERLLWQQPEAQERFLECWRDLSAALKQYDVAMVAYELMNEPVADSAVLWNKLLARAIKQIRRQEPTRCIIIGSNRYQDISTMAALEVPAGDKFLMLSFHYYNPFYLTHYQAPWTNIKDYSGPVHYPGPTVTSKELNSLPASIRNLLPGSTQDYSANLIAQQLREAIDIAKRLDLPLHCGEWGCLPTAPRKDRLRWYRDVRSVLEKNNIAWSSWEYKGRFGLINEDGETDKKLLKILVK